MKTIRITLDLEYPEGPGDIDAQDADAAHAMLTSIFRVPDSEHIARAIADQLLATFAGMDHLAGVTAHGELLDESMLMHGESRFRPLLYCARKWRDDPNWEEDVRTVLAWFDGVDIGPDESDEEEGVPS